MSPRIVISLSLLAAGCIGPASTPPGGDDVTTTSGGAGGGAGGSGAGQPDGGGGAGASGGGGSGGDNALFREDFEGGALEPGKWTEQIVSGGTLSVDGAHVHGGALALHADHSGFSTMLRAGGAELFPAERLYVRAWIFVEGALPTNHVIWVEAGTVMNDGGEVRIGMNAGQLDANHWPGDEDMRDPDAPVTADAWHCLELMVDGEAQLLEVRLDGATRTALTTGDWVTEDPANGNQNPLSMWSPPYEAVRFGWELGQGDIWYDDIALGRDDWLGCDP